MLCGLVAYLYANALVDVSDVAERIGKAVATSTTSSMRVRAWTEGGWPSRNDPRGLGGGFPGGHLRVVLRRKCR